MKNIKTKKPEKINFKYNLGMYLRFLIRYKYLFFTILFLGFILQTTLIVERFLFKVVIDNSTEFANGALLKGPFVQILIFVALIFISLFMIRTFGGWLDLHLVNVLESSMILDVKRKFFNHILHLSHRFHSTHRTGSLISRLLRGSYAIETMTDVFAFNLAPLVFQLVLVVGSVAYFDTLTAFVVFLTVACFILYSFVIQTIQQTTHLEANNIEDIEKGNISDIFTNIDSIKYFGKEDLIKSKFAKLSDNSRVSRLRSWHYFRYMDGGQAFILGVGLLLLVYFPLMKFLNNELSIGTLVFMYTVFGNLYGPMFGFVHGIRQFYRASGDLQYLFMYARMENEIKDKKDAKELNIKEGTVDFKNISFRYYKKNIFENFNLRINKNEKIALVGHSGSGKSTLVKLLYRLYDVDEGEILIDGRNIRGFKQESLRSELSIVPQECVLFDDTIYNNVAFSNIRASRKDVFKAMKFAQLDNVVKEFPKKEKTVVGERGVKLSGGEKQRVSIARAILANKKILVLDEATSSLDSETEHEIQKDLWELMKGRTTIVIAHRLSTIMRADKIVVLDKGKIVGVGTHKQLIKNPGKYKRLWDLQKGGYIK